MWPQKKLRYIILSISILSVFLLSGCKNTSTLELSWIDGKTIRATPQKLSETQRQKIKETLAPNGGDGLVLNGDTFYYRNTNLTDTEMEMPVKSKTQAIKMAEESLRSLDLLPANDLYYTRTDADSAGHYNSVLFYHKFGGLPLLVDDGATIAVAVCEKGISAIRCYSNWHKIEELPLENVTYISADDALRSCRDKLAGCSDGEKAKIDAIHYQRVYIYTNGQAKPMFMLSNSENPFINAIYVDALTGEVTDYPWGES